MLERFRVVRRLEGRNRLRAVVPTWEKRKSAALDGRGKIGGRSWPRLTSSPKGLATEIFC